MVWRLVPVVTLLAGALAGCGGTQAPAAARPSGTPAPGVTDPRSGVVLATALPSTGPARAPIWTLPGGPADAGTVHELARALGITAEPVRAGPGWRAAGRGVLEVSGAPGRQWTFHATGAPDRPAPPGTDVTAAAHRFAQAAGISTGPFRQTVGGVAVADLMAAGQPVASWRTEVTVAWQGKIVNAGGWLAPPVRGTAMKVITARQAYEALKRALATRPLPREQRQPCPQVEQEACPPGARGNVTITGVEFGLSLTYFGNRPMLAPSWLFVTRQGTVIPQVALAPERKLPAA